MGERKLKRFLRSLWEYIRDDGSFSYRSEAGVKLIVNGDGRERVDFDDPRTSEMLREDLEEMAKMDIVDGKLVRRAE